MPGYYYDGSQWRTLNSGYYYDGSSWRTINSGWYYTGSQWVQIFTTGTFTPTLRISGQTTPATARSVGLAIELYRGSTTSGTYAYQFQYAIGSTTSFSNETITGSSGTLTGATTTASFTTDSSYVTSLETIAYSGNNTGILDDLDTYRLQVAKQMYIRARVTKSGEIQFTNNVRIQKRQPINSGTLLRLRRASTGTVYTLTGNPSTDKQPFVGDTIYWEPSFQATTTLTNDTRPDYYWFNFDSNSGSYTRNSILSDPSNPKNPINGRSYTIQSSDLNGPVVCNLRAVNTNGSGTTNLTIATRDVSDGTLTAPTNLVLQYSSLSLVGTWDPAGGGNDTTITYTWFLERSTGGAYTQVASGNTTTQTFSSSQTTAGNYRFYVTAAQTGSPNVTSGYSNVFELKAPAAFNVTIQNVTNTDTYKPSLFTVSAPTLSSTVINRWDWTWTTSTILGPAYAKTGSFNTTTINNWTSTLTRPGGGTSTATVSSATDYWIITSSGSHTETVTANNNRKNYVRISWTRPAGTSAVSYRIGISAYSAATNGSIDWTRTINVEDVNYIDIEHDYAANGDYATGQTVLVTSVTAYNGAGQTGVSTSGTLPAFNANQDGAQWTACNVIGTRQASTTDNLTLENPTASFIYLTGTFEPSGIISVTGNRPSTGTTGWSPLFSDGGWTHTYQWYRSGTVSFGTISGATSPTLTIPSSSSYIGDVIDVNVASTYKGQSFGSRFDSTNDADGTVYPGAPVSFTINDNGNRTFSITNVSALGATHYYGSYSGTFGSGTIGETAIGGTWSSPQGFAGTVTVTLFARTYKTIIYPTNQGSVAFNSKTSASSQQTINPSAQDTGSRRFLSNAPSVGAGNTMYISTNGYFGNATMPTNNYLPSGGTLPSPGGFLNIAAQDLVMVYCYTKVDSGGTWIRYRGYRYNNPSGPFLEYQAYLTFSGSVYVLFIENGLTDYRASLAYFVSGTQQSTWASSSSDQSNFTVNQGTTGWTSRSVSTGTNDDGIVSFTVIAPARQHQASAATRTAGGFTFNITNVDDGLFESAATYGVSINLASPAAASINTSTGLVTVTGLTSNQFATVTVSKTRTGYENAANVQREGQALAGSPPSQATAPSISASGTADASGTVRRIQVGGTVSGSAGTYNNQQSITSGLLTILSNSYTGSDSDWTSAGSLGSSASITTSGASASANMYRWRDRVVGTDGSTVDFYTPVSYRAVYAPPPGGSFNSSTTNSITINYTGGSGAPRYYRYRDGVQIDFINDPGIGPAVTTFTGLSAGTSYTVLLYGGNTEGYLSVGSAGGTYSTAGNNLTAPFITGVSQTSPNGSLSVSFAGGSGPFYQIWWQSGADYSTVSGFDASGSSSPVTDTTGPGAGTWYVAVRSVSSPSNTGTGPSSTISAWSAPQSFTVSAGGSAPVLISITGDNSLALGGTFNWSFSNSPTAYSLFVQGPTGTVYTTSNAYTYGGTSFRPGYDGTGWQGAGNYTAYVSARNAFGDSAVASQTTFMN
jgi:hypothetical protein